MIHRARVAIAAGALLLAGLSAHATAANSNTYAFSCTNPSLTLTPVSFVLPITATAATTGAKVTFEPLTIYFAANKSYPSMFTTMVEGQHFTSCTLVQTTVVSGTTTVYTWSLSLAMMTGLTAMGTDASSPNYAGTYAPTGLMQASFIYGGLQVTAK